MKIPFDQFEQHIDETILQRGLQYFKKGRVDEPEEIAPGVYETIVDGTEPYTVRITIANEMITDHSCTCPYDLGPICKHIAAMIFYMQKDTLDLQQKTRGRKPKSTEKSVKLPNIKQVNAEPRPKKKLSVSEQVMAILDKLSDADKRAFILELCNHDRSFRQLFISRYLPLIMPRNKDLYLHQVKAALKANSDRNGYIGYHESNRAAKQIQNLVIAAQDALEQHNHEQAVLMAEAVIEGMEDVFNYADDSNGYLSDCVSLAFDIIFHLAQQEEDTEIHPVLFEFVSEAVQKHYYEGWDWNYNLYELLIILAKNEAEQMTVESLLNVYKTNKRLDSFDTQQLQMLQLNFIRKFKGEAGATAYMNEHISNPEFRKHAIEKALQNDKLSEALKLAQDGIRLHQKEAPGLSLQFKKILLNVYLKMNDTENIIKLARELMKEPQINAEQYFNILKKQIPPAEWLDFINQFLKEIATRAYWSDFELMADIFIWEERWVNLYKLIAGKPNLMVLDAYEKYLVKDYTAELIELYRKEILSYIATNVGRSHYRTACRYLRKLRKMGAGPMVDTMVAGLQRQYPTRKALMEELEKV